MTRKERLRRQLGIGQQVGGRDESTLPTGCGIQIKGKEGGQMGENKRKKDK